MSTNLVSAIMQFITPELLAKFASALGVDRGTTQKAVGAGIPAILAGLAGVASKPGGAQQLSSALEQVKPGSLENFIGAIGGPAQAARSEEGTNLLSSLARKRPPECAHIRHWQLFRHQCQQKRNTARIAGSHCDRARSDNSSARLGLDANGISHSSGIAKKIRSPRRLPSSLATYLHDSGLMDMVDGNIRRGAESASATDRHVAVRRYGRGGKHRRVQTGCGRNTATDGYVAILACWSRRFGRPRLDVHGRPGAAAAWLRKRPPASTSKRDGGQRQRRTRPSRI